MHGDSQAQTVTTATWVVLVGKCIQSQRKQSNYTSNETYLQCWSEISTQQAPLTGHHTSGAVPPGCLADFAVLNRKCIPQTFDVIRLSRNVGHSLRAEVWQESLHIRVQPAKSLQSRLPVIQIAWLSSICVDDNDKLGASDPAGKFKVLLQLLLVNNS
jgi:hypothetical protein